MKTKSLNQDAVEYENGFELGKAFSAMQERHFLKTQEGLWMMKH